MTYPHPMDDHTGFAVPGEADCDCCGKLRQLSRTSTTDSIETWACDECRGNDEN